MQSEIRKEIKPHDIILKSRKKVELTGIKKIISLNENEFILETTLGKVLISGDSLSDETINELFLIEKGKIKTENIFKYFENKQLDKNNNHYVKKLILSKE